MDQAGVDVLGQGRHFTGTGSTLLLDFVEAEVGSDGVATVLEQAGETRSLDELRDPSAWLSYGEFRRLLEAAASVLGGTQALARIWTVSPRPPDVGNSTETAIHDLGSPDALYGAMKQATHVLSSVYETLAEQVGEQEWLATTQMLYNLEPFPELCAFLAGLAALLPIIYGLPPADVVHEECCCEGGSACRSRIRWFSADDPALRADYLQRRVRVLESELRRLRESVHELVSGAGITELLARIVRSASGAVLAPAHLLALWPPDGRIEATGPDPEAAATWATRILSSDLDDGGTFLAVDVASTRRRYGRLAAIDSGGRGFLGPERLMLEVYASLAVPLSMRRTRLTRLVSKQPPPRRCSRCRLR